MPVKIEVLIPVLVFAVALALRIIGLGWGLKNDLHSYSYHPDEPDIFLYSQAIEPGKGKFSPGFYNYGTLYLTALRIASDMTATYTGGMDPQKPETVTEFMSKAHLVGRSLSALAGALMAVFGFLILRRLTNVLGALFGAGLIAFAPGAVVNSHYQTVDMLSACFVAASTLCALRLLDRQISGKDALRFSVLAGVFAGLSAATKYTGGLVVLTAVASAGLSGRKDWWREGAASVAAMLLVFVVGTPGVLTDTTRFIRDFKYEALHTSTGHGIEFTATSSGFIYHFANLGVGVGLLLTLLGLAGLVIAAARKHSWAIALLVFFVPYYLLIGRAEVKFLRYTLPLYVGLATGFGWMIGKAHERKGYGQAVVGLGILGLGGIDGGGLRGTAAYDLWMAQQDPRDQAAHYLKDLAASDPQMSVGYVSDPWFYSVPLFKESSAPRRFPFDARMTAMDAAQTPKLLFYRSRKEDPFAFDTRLITEAKPDYITLSTFETGPLERMSHASGLLPLEKLQADRYTDFYRLLQVQYTLARSFGGPAPTVHDMEYVQPNVTVWKRKNGS